MSQDTHHLIVDAEGRVTIPAELLAALGMDPGEPVIVRREAGELRLVGLPESVRRAQAIVRRYVPEGRSLSDELIAERRAEAERE